MVAIQLFDQVGEVACAERGVERVIVGDKQGVEPELLANEPGLKVAILSTRNWNDAIIGIVLGALPGGVFRQQLLQLPISARPIDLVLKNRLVFERPAS